MNNFLSAVIRDIFYPLLPEPSPPFFIRCGQRVRVHNFLSAVIREICTRCCPDLRSHFLSAVSSLRFFIRCELAAIFYPLWARCHFLSTAASGFVCVIFYPLSFATFAPAATHHTSRPFFIRCDFLSAVGSFPLGHPPQVILPLTNR